MEHAAHRGADCLERICRSRSHSCSDRRCPQHHDCRFETRRGPRSHKDDLGEHVETVNCPEARPEAEGRAHQGPRAYLGHSSRP